jgi:uncharacterized protein
MRGLGTLVNMATVLLGTGVGLLVGRRVPERVRETVLAGIALLTIGVGVSSFLATRNAVFPVVSIVLGALVGEALRIEDRLESAGERLRARVEPDPPPLPDPSLVERDPEEVMAPAPSSFVDGFVIASLTFCVGALTVVGSLQDGVGNGAQLLVVKAALDGVVAVVFASVYGWGVGFSALSILVLQGSVTGIGALAGETLLDERMVAEMEATGGPMIIGVGLRLLALKEIRLASFLPGLAIAPVLVAIFAV